MFLEACFSKNRPAGGNLYNDAKTCVFEGSLFQKIDPPEATCTTTPKLVFWKGPFCKKTIRQRQPVQRRQNLCFQGSMFQKIDPPEATCTTTPKLVFLGVHFSKNRPAGGNLYNDAQTCVLRCPFFKKSTRRRQPVQRRQDLCF